MVLSPEQLETTNFHQFEIVPRGVISGEYGNILHFTSGDDCCAFGTRSPLISFLKGTTRLHYRMGDSTVPNWGFDTDEDIHLNVRTTITLECNGSDVKLTVGANVYTAKQPTRRFAGDLIAYAGSPWNPAANAEVYNLDYKILPAIAKNGKTTITNIN